MARKLGLGWGLAWVAATLLAGCQSPGTTRVASNNNYKNTSVARQGTSQTSTFPQYGPANKSGFSSANTNVPPPDTAAAFGANSQYPARPDVSQFNTATNNSPLGPQFGTPTTAGNNNVTITQPTVPSSSPLAPVSLPPQSPSPPGVPMVPAPQ